MKRIMQPHILRFNHGEEFPERWIFFDTETKPLAFDEVITDHHFFLGVACFVRYDPRYKQPKEEWLEFKEKEVFWNWVERYSKGKKKLVLCAHNVTFDFIVLDGFRALLARGWDLTKLISDGHVNVWKFRKDKATIQIVDSLNWFAGSLKDIGTQIGVPKMSIDFNECSDEELMRYCRNDVFVLVKLFTAYHQFHKSNPVGNFAATLAGQAFNSFRHRFMHTPIYIHCNEEIDERERLAYFGGRTEAFFIGKLPQANYYYLDVNSLYPSVMRHNLYPTRYVVIDSRMDASKLRRAMAEHFVIAQVVLNTSVPAYPKVHDNRLIFPIGEFITTLATPELSYALEHNHIQSVSWAHLYEQADVFTEYVDYWYPKRREYKAEGNQVMAYFTKIFLNSLYGKFGQRGGKWEEIGETDVNRLEYTTQYNQDGSKTYYRMMAGLVQSRHVEGCSFDTLTAVAAAVTSYARMLLWNLITTAGRNNVYYVDTDSLFVNEQGYNRLANWVDVESIGKLKVEDKDFDLEIRGLKDYSFGAVTKTKGVSKSARLVAPNTYRQEHWPSLQGLLRRGSISSYHTYMVEKELKREYLKGTVTGSGYVAPFLFLNNEKVAR